MKRPDSPIRPCVLARIGELVRQAYETCPAFRARIDRKARLLEEELDRLGETLDTASPETLERIWRERIVPEIEKSAVAS